MGLFRKKKRGKEYNYMELTPVCNYGHNVKDDGLIDVLVPRFTDKIFGKYLQPHLKYKYIRANMDEFGSATWSLMDGKRKVYEIANELTDKFGESIQPVEERLTNFLTNLYTNDFISFIEFRKGKENG